MAQSFYRDSQKIERITPFLLADIKMVIIPPDVLEDIYQFELWGLSDCEDLNIDLMPT